MLYFTRYSVLYIWSEFGVKYDIYTLLVSPTANTVAVPPSQSLSSADVTALLADTFWERA